MQDMTPGPQPVKPKVSSYPRRTSTGPAISRPHPRNFPVTKLLGKRKYCVSFEVRAIKIVTIQSNEPGQRSGLGQQYDPRDTRVFDLSM